MKMVLNNSYGGFNIPRELFEVLGCREFGIGYEGGQAKLRREPALIEWVESHKGDASFGYAELAVIDIPEEATDWEISEYDGMEHIIAVIDGKIEHLYPEYEED